MTLQSFYTNIQNMANRKILISYSSLGILIFIAVRVYLIKSKQKRLVTASQDIDNTLNNNIHYRISDVNNNEIITEGNKSISSQQYKELNLSKFKVVNNFDCLIPEIDDKVNNIRNIIMLIVPEDICKTYEIFNQIIYKRSYITNDNILEIRINKPNTIDDLKLDQDNCTNEENIKPIEINKFPGTGEGEWYDIPCQLGTLEEIKGNKPQLQFKVELKMTIVWEEIEPKLFRKSYKAFEKNKPTRKSAEWLVRKLMFSKLSKNSYHITDTNTLCKYVDTAFYDSNSIYIILSINTKISQIGLHIETW